MDYTTGLIFFLILSAVLHVFMCSQTIFVRLVGSQKKSGGSHYKHVEFMLYLYNMSNQWSHSVTNVSYSLRNIKATLVRPGLAQNFQC